MSNNPNIPDLFSQTVSMPLTPERNRHSGNQEILEENRKHFEGQTDLILRLMKMGEKVSSKEMARKYGIIDTRARIYSIRKAGYDVIEAKIKDGHGAKEWSLKNEVL